MAFSCTSSTLLLFITSMWCVTYGRKTRLVIGGLAGINIQTAGWSSSGVIPAIELALERVNKFSDILKEYYLVVDWRDSQCMSGYAIKGLVELISENPHKIAFLGPGCSVAAQPVAEAIKFWNLTQIGFSATSAVLGDKTAYPNFFRVNPPETVHHPAVVAIMESLTSMLSRNNKQFQVESYFNNAANAIRRLKKHDARIVVLLMFEDEARKVICSAFHNDFYGNHIVWIVRGWYSTKWWETAQSGLSCTVEQMKKVLVNVLSIIHIFARDDEYTKVIGLTKSEFMEQYKDILKKKNDSLFYENSYATYGYDSVLTLAKALNHTEEILKTKNQSLRDFSYSRGDITEIVKSTISKTDLKGVSGRIKIDEGGDRLTDVWIQQLQDNLIQNIAKYYKENNSLVILPRKNFSWVDGVVPLDSRTVNNVVLRISPAMFIWTAVASACGIFMAFYFLGINLKNGSKSFFKVSSPPLNNFIILGAIILYLYVLILGLKFFVTETEFLFVVCKVMHLLLPIGFSLTFGTMFVKTWRVYRIFTNVKLSKELKFLSNKHLIATIFTMTLFDVLYFLVWNFVHPLHDVLSKINTRSSIKVSTVYLSHECSSLYYKCWFWGLAVCKGILLVFGMFFTWETRNVSFPGLNESKYVGMCVYNVVIFAVVLTLIQSFTFAEQIDTRFAISAGGITFCTTTILLLTFVPKIVNSNRGSAPVSPAQPSCSVLTNDWKHCAGKTTRGQCATCKRQF